MSTREQATPRSWRRIAAGGAAALFLLLAAAEASAQTQPGDDLLRVLKPWLKRQLLGGDDPAPAAEAEAAPADGEETGPDAAALPEASGETEASGGTTGETEPDAALAETPAAQPGAEKPPDAAGAGPQLQPAPESAGVSPFDPSPEEAVEIPADSATGALGSPAEPVDARPLDTGPPLPQATPPLRFGVLAGRSAAATMAAVGPLADDLGAAIGRPVELLALPSYASMIDAQVERRIDGGFFSASAFALAELRCRCLEPIVAPRASDGTLAYHAVIVARANSGISSAFDLEGRTVAVGAADSVGARRMQLAGLMASGMDPASAFGGVIEVASAADAVRLMRDGAADAAFAWSSLAGDAAAGYSRGTLSNLVAGGELSMRDVAIVWRSPPVAHGPFAVANTLKSEEKDRIGAVFLALEATRPEAYDMLNPFYAGGYSPVDPEDYRGLETLAAQNVDALELPRGVARVGADPFVQPEAPGSIEPGILAPGTFTPSPAN